MIPSYQNLLESLVQGVNNLANRVDEVNQKMEDFKTEVRQQIGNVAAELHQKIDGVKAEFNTRAMQIATEMRSVPVRIDNSPAFNLTNQSTNQQAQTIDVEIQAVNKSVTAMHNDVRAALNQVAKQNLDLKQDIALSSVQTSGLQSSVQTTNTAYLVDKAVNILKNNSELKSLQKQSNTQNLMQWQSVQNLVTNAVSLIQDLQANQQMEKVNKAHAQILEQTHPQNQRPNLVAKWLTDMLGTVAAFDIVLKTHGSVGSVVSKIPVQSVTNLPMTGALVVGSLAANATLNHLLSSTNASMLTKGQLVRNQAIHQGKKVALEAQLPSQGESGLSIAQTIYANITKDLREIGSLLRNEVPDPGAGTSDNSTTSIVKSKQIPWSSTAVAVGKLTAVAISGIALPGTPAALAATLGVIRQVTKIVKSKEKTKELNKETMEKLVEASIQEYMLKRQVIGNPPIHGMDPSYQKDQAVLGQLAEEANRNIVSLTNPLHGVVPNEPPTVASAVEYEKKYCDLKKIERQEVEKQLNRWEKIKQDLSTQIVSKSLEIEQTIQKREEYQKALDSVQAHSVSPVNANPVIERVHTDYVNRVQSELQHATTKLNQITCERDQLIRDLEDHKNSFDPDAPVKLALVLMELHSLGQLNENSPSQNLAIQGQSGSGGSAGPGEPSGDSGGTNHEADRSGEGPDRAGKGPDAMNQGPNMSQGPNQSGGGPSQPHGGNSLSSEITPAQAAGVPRFSINSGKIELNGSAFGPYFNSMIEAFGSKTIPLESFPNTLSQTLSPELRALFLNGALALEIYYGIGAFCVKTPFNNYGIELVNLQTGENCSETDLVQAVLPELDGQVITDFVGDPLALDATIAIVEHCQASPDKSLSFCKKLVFDTWDWELRKAWPNVTAQEAEQLKRVVEESFDSQLALATNNLLPTLQRELWGLKHDSIMSSGGLTTFNKQSTVLEAGLNPGEPLCGRLALEKTISWVRNTSILDPVQGARLKAIESLVTTHQGEGALSAQTSQKQLGEDASISPQKPLDGTPAGLALAGYVDSINIPSSERVSEGFWGSDSAPSVRGSLVLGTDAPSPSTKGLENPSKVVECSDVMERSNVSHSKKPYETKVSLVMPDIRVKLLQIVDDSSDTQDNLRLHIDYCEKQYIPSVQDLVSKHLPNGGTCFGESLATLASETADVAECP
nr:putative chromosome segregation protein SMC [Eudorina cylindrica]QKN19295.1 putative chromosome segregation protein SMC [Eudorina cylindrica]